MLFKGTTEYRQFAVLYSISNFPYAPLIQDKPGKWMYDAVEALKAQREADDEPP